MSMPPKDQIEFKKLGENIYLYRGQYRHLSGLWVKNENPQLTFVNSNNKDRIEALSWDQYRLGSSAKLFFHDDYSFINPESLLPENFEKIAKKFTKETGDKRPIFTMNIDVNDEPFNMYIKGAYITQSIFYQVPKNRLTTLAGISKVSSLKELNITLD